MKLNTLKLYAAALVMALAASSAQAEVIYESQPSSNSASCCLPYGPDSNPNAFYQIGDYIQFGGTARNLTKATFLLNSNLLNPAALGLTLYIYTADGTLLDQSTTTSGTWSASNPFNYSFLFNNLLVPNEIVYALSLTNDPVNDPVSAGNLNIALTSLLPSTGQDLAGTDLLSNLLGPGLNLNAGEVIATDNNLITSAVSFGNQEFGIVAKFEAAAVPEPATLALLSFGLVGLGAARRRKAAH